jgi:hypothetical protein
MAGPKTELRTFDLGRQCLPFLPRPVGGAARKREILITPRAVTGFISRLQKCVPSY